MTYDQSYIVDKFRGLIGFKASYDHANIDAGIDDDLGVSTSGQYVNRFHTLFTPENFANCVSQFSQFTVKTWDTAITYNKEDVVRQSGAVYQALKTNAAQNPTSNPDDWKKTTLLSVWFRSVYDGSVLEVLDRLMEQKKLEGHGKELRGSTALFSNNGSRSNVVSKVSGRFVGFELSLKHPNMSVQLHRLGLQLSENTSGVPIHVLYKGEDTVLTFDYSKKGSSFEYFNVPDTFFLSFEGSAIIGYYEDDLIGSQAVYQSTALFDSDYCSTCGGSDSGSRSVWSQYVNVNPITMDSEDEITYETDTNFGLNLVMVFRCDFSDVLIGQRESVVPALKAQLRISLLQALSDSLRANGQADAIANLAFSEMKDFTNPDNPTKVLNRAIKALSFELSGLYEKCIPCEKKVSFRTRSI